MNKKVLGQLKKAKKAAATFGTLPHDVRKRILKKLAREIRRSAGEIIRANADDLKNFPSDDPMRDRLVLDEARIENMAREIEHIAALPDPIGEMFDERKRQGLDIRKIRVPLGVVGVIYESRPNVTTDVAAICIKSGNVAVLKGGREAERTSAALHKIIRKVLASAGADPDAITLIDPKEKDGAQTLIAADGLIDAVIPRGSQNLIRFVRENATVPFIETGAGVCHTFVDNTADLSKSAAVVLNAKTQRPSVCNALDTLLVHEKTASRFLPMLAGLLAGKKVEIYADPKSFRILARTYPGKLLHKARRSDFGREFLSQKMSVRTVSGVDEAIRHIREYSSGHSEAILSESEASCRKFLAAVDAAAVYVNASTRFSDGAVFGLGSEIGISTSKLHARGPMGPKEITTYKWIVKGKYSVRK